MKKALAKLSPKEITALAKDAQRWVASSEGRKALKEALECADQVTTQLSSERLIDPKALRRPLTL